MHPFYPAAYQLCVRSRRCRAGDYIIMIKMVHIATSYANLLNYELAAPGSGIMSTIPNGGYATLNRNLNG